MHAVRAALERQVGPVVHEEEGAVPVAELAQLAPRGDQRLVGRRLVPQLDHVHAAAQGGRHHIGGRRLEHEVEAGGLEPHAHVAAIDHAVDPDRAPAGRLVA